MSKDDEKLSEDAYVRGMNIKGEVRISSRDYLDLLQSATDAEKAQEQYQSAIDSIRKWLTFLRTKEEIDFNKLMNEFNDEISGLTMWIDENGRVRIGVSDK